MKKYKLKVFLSEDTIFTISEGYKPIWTTLKDFPGYHAVMAVKEITE